MKSKRFGFLRHSRKMKIEGTDNAGFFNRCIRNGIALRNIRWHSPLESYFESEGGDKERIRKAAGNSYRLTVVDERGMVPVLRYIRKNIVTVAGAFLLGALIFYQSMFVTEIRIDGYGSIPEAEIRSALSEAGVREGMKKQGEYSDARQLLYSRFATLSWVSFHERGRMLEVSVAESGDDFIEKKRTSDKRPVDIIASKSGIIEKVDPLNGSARVKKGDYVNKGSVVISGKYRYQSSDYSRGDKFFTMYSHAEGSVLARVPEHLTLYYDKYDRKKQTTSRSYFGIMVKAGDRQFDTGLHGMRYRASVKEKHKVVDIVKPVPFSVYTYVVHEVELTEYPADMDKINRHAEASAREHFRRELSGSERVTDMSIEYTESAGLIRAYVFAEVIEEIGVEKVLKVKEKNRHNE